MASSPEKHSCWVSSSPEPDTRASNTYTSHSVHGLGSSQNYYTALIPAFTSQNVRCIALDTTGQGRSPYTGIEQSVHSLAADIIGVMDTLSISKAVIIGHSMAGLTIPMLASTWPNRISAAILVGPVYPNPATIPVFEDRIAKVEKDGMQPMADTIPYTAVGSQATSLHHAFIRELLLASQPDGYVSMCRVINAASADPRQRPDYSRVTCPVYVIAGDEDKSAPVAGCRRILDEVGTVKEEKRMVVLEKTGHWMCIERPEAVAQAIWGFFDAAQ